MALGLVRQPLELGRILAPLAATPPGAAGFDLDTAPRELPRHQRGRDENQQGDDRPQHTLAADPHRDPVEAVPHELEMARQP